MSRIGKWWRKRQKQRRCFHHDHVTGETWMRSQMIDHGKFFWCRKCDKGW